MGFEGRRKKFFYELPAPLYPDEYFVPFPKWIDSDVKDGYYISNYGRCFRAYGKGRELSYAIDSKGYPYYNLAIEGSNTGRNFRVHRLLKLIFDYTDGCENLDIHHKDSNKENFSLSNLQWCDKSYNMQEAYRLNEITNLQGEDRPMAKITNEQAEEICRRVASGEVMSKIAKEMNVSPDTVYSISSGKAWKSISSKYNFSEKNKYNKYTYNGKELK